MALPTDKTFKTFDLAQRHATLMKEKRIVYADPLKVKAVAGNLEAMISLTEEMNPHEQVPISMSVIELQHFVSYMRALDSTARNLQMENESLKSQNKRLQTVVDEQAAKIVGMDAAIRTAARVTNRDLVNPPRKTLKLKPSDVKHTLTIMKPKKARGE